VNFSGTYGSGD